jgi:hypothetical protein
MNETPEELAELATDILTEGIDVNINVGPKEVLAVVAIAATVTVVSNIALGTLTVALRRKLAKLQAAKETES